MKHCILAILTAMSMFACDECTKSAKKSDITTMQKPARCKTLLRYSFEVGHSLRFDIAECINIEGNRTVFYKDTAQGTWIERVMLEK